MTPFISLCHEENINQQAKNIRHFRFSKQSLLMCELCGLVNCTDILEDSVVAQFSEMLVPFYHIIWCHIPGKQQSSQWLAHQGTHWKLMQVMLFTVLTLHNGPSQYKIKHITKQTDNSRKCKSPSTRRQKDWTIPRQKPEGSQLAVDLPITFLLP
jgi:hypothetical protein